MTDTFRTTELVASIGEVERTLISDGLRVYQELTRLSEAINSLVDLVRLDIKALEKAVDHCDGRAALSAKGRLFNCKEDITGVVLSLRAISTGNDAGNEFVRNKAVEQAENAIDMVRPYVEECEPPSGLDSLADVVSTGTQ